MSLFTIASPTDNAKESWRWKEIQLGVSDLQYAEVLSGLEPGDRVVASPASPLPTRSHPQRRDQVAERRPNAAQGLTTG